MTPGPVSGVGLIGPAGIPWGMSSPPDPDRDSTSPISSSTIGGGIVGTGNFEFRISNNLTFFTGTLLDYFHSLYKN